MNKVLHLRLEYPSHNEVRVTNSHYLGDKELLSWVLTEFDVKDDIEQYVMNNSKLQTIPLGNKEEWEWILKTVVLNKLRSVCEPHRIEVQFV